MHCDNILPSREVGDLYNRYRSWVTYSGSRNGGPTFIQGMGHSLCKWVTQLGHGFPIWKWVTQLGYGFPISGATYLHMMC